MQREPTLLADYPAQVKPEQRIIADWLIRTAAKHGLSLGAWAEKAGIGAGTTLTRAVKEDYSSVTTIPTLEALARAVGEPSLLEALQSEGDRRSASLPSEEALASILSAVLPLARGTGNSARSTRVVAAALRRGLELLGEQSASTDPGVLGLASREAVARLRDLQRG